MKTHGKEILISNWRTYLLEKKSYISTAECGFDFRTYYIIFIRPPLYVAHVARHLYESNQDIDEIQINTRQWKMMKHASPHKVVETQYGNADLLETVDHAISDQNNWRHVRRW